MVPTPPKLIYEIQVNPKPFRRRFAWSALATVASVGALIALDRAGQRGNIDTRLLLVGQVIGLIVLILFSIRTLQNLWRGITRKNERLRFYDKGFVWKREADEYKYAWSQLQIYRDSSRGLYLGKYPLIQLGAYLLKMQDGKTFRITGAHGDIRAFASAVKRYVSYATGVHLGRALRQDEIITLHPRLKVQSDGIFVGKEGVHWSDTDVNLRHQRLLIRRKEANGKVRKIRSYDTRTVNNVGGFMEVAVSAIQNHQPERFQKRELS